MRERERERCVHTYTHKQTCIYKSGIELYSNDLKTEASANLFTMYRDVKKKKKKRQGGYQSFRYSHPSGKRLDSLYVCVSVCERKKVPEFSFWGVAS